MAASSAIRIRTKLADYGLRRKTVTDLIFDETWQVLDVGGPAQIATLDRIVRLQRGESSTITTCSHSVRDYKQVSDSVHDQARATGHIARSRIKIIGPCNADEIDAQEGIIAYTEREKELLIGWSNSASPTRLGRRAVHAGMGHFLMKWGDDPARPGVPFYTVVSDLERELGIHETSASMRHDTE